MGTWQLSERQQEGQLSEANPTYPRLGRTAQFDPTADSGCLYRAP